MLHGFLFLSLQSNSFTISPLSAMPIHCHCSITAKGSAALFPGCPLRIFSLHCLQSSCTSQNMPSFLHTFQVRPKQNYMKNSFKVVLIQCYKWLLADTDETPHMSDGTLLTRINLTGRWVSRQLCELRTGESV